MKTNIYLATINNGFNHPYIEFSEIVTGNSEEEARQNAMDEFNNLKNYVRRMGNAFLRDGGQLEIKLKFENVTL